tara:strand:+ start:524 stop:808 length:285 start_codon:yes stop_codon:yes gene_type:complete
MRKKYFYCVFKNIFFSLIIATLTSCASENKRFIEYYKNLDSLEGFNLKNFFLIKDNVYAIKCDSLGNKLLIRFSNNGKKWKRTKYISRDCTLKL